MAIKKKWGRRFYFIMSLQLYLTWHWTPSSSLAKKVDFLDVNFDTKTLINFMIKNWRIVTVLQYLLEATSDLFPRSGLWIPSISPSSRFRISEIATSTSREIDRPQLSTTAGFHRPSLPLYPPRQLQVTTVVFSLARFQHHPTWNTPIPPSEQLQSPT